MNNFIKIKSMRHEERQSLYVKFDPLFEKIDMLFQHSSGEVHKAYSGVLDIISDMAAAVKGETVKWGHWIYVDGIFKCSICNYEFEHEGYTQFFNYCPNCGAKMGNDTIAEKPFSILNCPECGGEVDMGKMCIDGNKKIATAMFECKKCHKYANILTDYTNNPRTALCLEWNRSVVAEEAHKTVKSAAEEAVRKGVPVDCAKCRFYNKQFEICRKKNERVLPFCFCYDGEEREYRVKTTTVNPNWEPEHVQSRYAVYFHDKILNDGGEEE